MAGDGSADGRLRPFRVQVDDEALADLDRRLAATRWPDPPPGPEWRWGTSLTVMQDIVAHWRTGFDWRTWEARLNAHEQYLARLAHGEVQVLVERGSGADPLPIVLTHGWPGSVFELIDLVEPLAHPERFGGSPDDGFTVVLPSLPGFGFSPAPDRVIGPRDVAGMWHELMTDLLGFPRYVAHGGDIGASVTSWLGLDHGHAIPAIHLNTATLQAMWTLADRPPDAEEQAWLERADIRRTGEKAYQNVHGEKPATLSFGISDSPVGLAAWIIEKFHGWTVPDAPGTPPLDRDHLIANVLTYWFGTCQPVHWMYQALLDMSGYRAPDGCRVDVPTGFCLFPDDIATPPPDAWLRRAYAVARVTRAPSGGHFPGIENGALLVDDIRGFFRAYRQRPI